MKDTAGLLHSFRSGSTVRHRVLATRDIVEKAELAANRIRDLVVSLVQALPDAGLLQHWQRAREAFNWKVDLTKFKDGSRYPGFFNRIIEAAQTSQFEDDFRAELTASGNVERAAEVIYWKNAGNFKAKDKITRDLLDWIDSREGWVKFADALKRLADVPTWSPSEISSCAVGRLRASQRR
jgi:hypothetical protein